MERKSEKKSDCMSESESVNEWTSEIESVCVCEREREKEREKKREREREKEREREREREKERERERKKEKEVECRGCLRRAWGAMKMRRNHLRKLK